MPYGMDVWRVMGDAAKVLNVVWSDHDAIVVSYRGGPWEEYLARMAASCT
jgi:hypothetical protein